MEMKGVRRRRRRVAMMRGCMLSEQKWLSVSFSAYAWVGVRGEPG